jgi:hypothetical protein
MLSMVREAPERVVLTLPWEEYVPTPSICVAPLAWRAAQTKTTNFYMIEIAI